MKFLVIAMSDNSYFEILRNKLDGISKKIDPDPAFNKTKHDSESRFNITKLFLKWYFCLISGSFVFAAVYNFIAANINIRIPENQINYLDVSNTVSIITTTLSGAAGFVIGYYFKTKDDA